MKGVIFILLEEEITDEFGPDAWDEILDETGLEGVYTTLGNYPHEEFVSLLGAAEPYIGETGRDAQKWFGRRALHRFTEKHPHLFEQHDSVISFVENLNQVIHPEVRKLYPEAPVPRFDIDKDPTQGDVSLAYDSPRGLCSFAEGLVIGTGDWYEQGVRVEQPVCVHEGGKHCEILIEVEEAG